MIESAEIENRFTHHPPANDDVIAAHTDVRRWCRDLATDLNHLLKDGRQKSLALTALEDVMLRANASIAQDGLP